MHGRPRRLACRVAQLAPPRADRVRQQACFRVRRGGMLGIQKSARRRESAIANAGPPRTRVTRVFRQPAYGGLWTEKAGRNVCRRRCLVVTKNKVRRNGQLGFGRIRARAGPRAHERRPCARQGARREAWPRAEAHAASEAQALKRRDAGDAVREIARQVIRAACKRPPGSKPAALYR